MNNQFEADIEIVKSGDVRGKVFDIENEEEYLPLRYLSQEKEQGAFVSRVRESYIEILSDIREKCFKEKYFVSDQINRITERITTEYSDKPLFMWDKFPDCAVFKNTDTKKWYGIVMNVKRSQLGEMSNNEVEIINLKINKDKIQELLKKNGYYPAWHMNKKLWISIALDETISDDEIWELVKESHSYTEKTLGKKQTKTK
jgi:predicted DNA-binding protein (MmcQ/YjbR family)